MNTNKMSLFGKKFKCSMCGAKFKTQQELDEHAKSHAPQQPVTAPVQTPPGTVQVPQQLPVEEHDTEQHQ